LLKLGEFFRCCPASQNQQVLHASPTSEQIEVDTFTKEVVIFLHNIFVIKHYDWQTCVQLSLQSEHDFFPPLAEQPPPYHLSLVGHESFTKPVKPNMLYTFLLHLVEC